MLLFVLLLLLLLRLLFLLLLLIMLLLRLLLLFQVLLRLFAVVGCPGFGQVKFFRKYRCESVVARPPRGHGRAHSHLTITPVALLFPNPHPDKCVAYIKFEKFPDICVAYIRVLR